MKSKFITEFEVDVKDSPEPLAVNARIVVRCDDDRLRSYALQELRTAVKNRARQLAKDAALPANRRRNTTQGFAGA